MKILVQFPTLNRKDSFLHCLEKYESMSSKNNDILFNINCDAGDVSMNNNETIKNIDSIITKSKYKINYLINSNKISSINAHIDDNNFDVLLCASDDMIPVIQSWDLYISSNMIKYFPELDGALHFNDGYARDSLITLSIMGYKLYKYFGYIYHPDYKSLYCDNEFTEVVYGLNAVKYIDDIIIKHEHYTRDGNVNSGKYDQAAQKTLFYAGRDHIVFKERKFRGFPRERITND